MSDINLGQSYVSSYLGDHHMAVKCSFTIALCRFGNVRANLGDNWRTPCEVRYEVAIPIKLQANQLSVIVASEST